MDFEFNIKYVIIAIVLILFILKKSFASHPLIKKYNHVFSLLIVLVLVVMISIEFWEESRIFSIGAIVLGFLASFFVAKDIWFDKK